MGFTQKESGFTQKEASFIPKEGAPACGPGGFWGVGEEICLWVKKTFLFGIKGLMVLGV